MELPLIANGNRYTIVFQALLQSGHWSLPHRTKNKKDAKLLAKEVVTMFGIPLSDRGSNLSSYLMQDVCKLLGIQNIDTTAHLPQCNGMVEWFNRTLKTMLWKHVSKFDTHWDSFLSVILWAYCNIPHFSTGEKPSFLLFGLDC